MLDDPQPNEPMAGAPVLSQLAHVVSRFYAIALWTTAAIIVGYLILLPPQIDVLQSLAWADLESLGGHFPGSASDFWLSRGIGYKILVYVMEGIARNVAGDAFRVRIYIFNGIYMAMGLALIAGAIAAIASKPHPNTAVTSWRDRAETLAFGGLLFLPSTMGSWAQDTHLANLLCVLGIGMALSPNERAQRWSGLIVILFLSVKGITVLNLLFVVVIVLATGDWGRIRRVAISITIAGMVAALAYGTLLRREFDTLLLGARFAQHYQGLHAFVSAAIQFAWRNPCIPVALACLAAALWRGLISWQSTPRLFSVAIAVWLIPLVAIFAQGEFLLYHYQGFVLSAWLCVAALYLAWGGQLSDLLHIADAPARTKGLVLLACIIALSGMAFALAGSPLSRYSFIGSERGLQCELHATELMRARVLSLAPNVVEEGGVLNLTAFSYGLELPSASRFFYPLPLHPQNIATPEGQDYVHWIESYDGTVVITGRNIYERPDLAPILKHLRAGYRSNRIADNCADMDVWVKNSN